MVENGEISGDIFKYEHKKAIEGQEYRKGYFCQFVEPSNSYLKSILKACNSEIFDSRFTIDCKVFPNDEIIATSDTNSVIIAYRIYEKGKIIIRKIAIKDGDLVEIIRDENNKVKLVHIKEENNEN